MDNLLDKLINGTTVFIGLFLVVVGFTHFALLGEFEDGTLKVIASVFAGLLAVVTTKYANS